MSWLLPPVPTYAEISPWTGRFYSLLDPSYAKNNIPIIASVSEHQPTTWSSFYFDLQLLVFMFPGKHACHYCGPYHSTSQDSPALAQYHDTAIPDYRTALLCAMTTTVLRLNMCILQWASSFASQSWLTRTSLLCCMDWRRSILLWVVILAIASCDWFCDGVRGFVQGVMVRLMLVLAPVMCILSGIAVSGLLSSFMKNLDVLSPRGRKKKPDANYPLKNEVAGLVVVMITGFLIAYTFHCTWVSPYKIIPNNAHHVFCKAHKLKYTWCVACNFQVTSEAYSSPSIVLAASQHDGSRIIFDDFREAYYWLRQNTPEDAKVMSWWDYGYQITAMANRTILVDNNTWNNTHISRVGQVKKSLPSPPLPLPLPSSLPPPSHPISPLSLPFSSSSCCMMWCACSVLAAMYRLCHLPKTKRMK